jgi:hypothetical protein
MKVHIHHFPKIKSQEESQNSMNQGFSYYFCMMTEGSGSATLVIDKPGIYLPQSNETRPEKVEGGPQVQRIWIRGRASVLFRNSQMN